MNASPAAATAPLVAAALAYARQGWPVLRLRPGDKIPAEQHGLRDATLDPAEIERRFASWRGNLGAVVPLGFVVVDADGEHALPALAARGISLPATATQRTPRGRHFVYRMPHGVEARQTVGELAPGVDTRAGGRGYIVAAPSVVAGVSYSWEVPLRDDRIADAPAALLALLGTAPPSPASTSPASTGRRSTSRRGPLYADPADLLANGEEEGSRNDRLFRCCCALRGVGGDEHAIARYAVLVAARCRPPLTRHEALQVARAACRYPAGEA